MYFVLRMFIRSFITQPAFISFFIISFNVSVGIPTLTTSSAYASMWVLLLYVYCSFSFYLQISD